MMTELTAREYVRLISATAADLVAEDGAGSMGRVVPTAERLEELVKDYLAHLRGPAPKLYAGHDPLTVQN